MFIIMKINEYRSMLWSLWIIYILFAEKFKAKINTIFSVLENVFSLWFIFRKWSIFKISIIKKGAHLTFAMGATLHRYATAHK